MCRALVYLVFSLIFLTSQSSWSEKPINYDRETLAFGPNGERGDLSLTFHSEFLKKFEPSLKQPTFIVWLTERGTCHDSGSGCAASALKVPHCRLSVERQGFPGEVLIIARKVYGPMVNQEFAMVAKVVEGGVRVEGVHSHSWKFSDPNHRSVMTLKCGPAQGVPASSFSKNLFTRISGDAFQFSTILTETDKAPELPKPEKPKSREHE